MAARRTPTMAELVEQVKTELAEVRVRPLVPGQRNRDDVLATPDGERMDLVGHLEPAEAAAAVAAGALVVSGACGCGETDCGRLLWLDRDRLQGTVPVLDRRAPTWLALWRSSSHEVVFTHGGISWQPIR